MFAEGDTVVSPYGPGIVRGLERCNIEGKEGMSSERRARRGGEENRVE
jgi:hypothetical protein